jgi:hypothetical protein
MAEKQAVFNAAQQKKAAKLALQQPSVLPSRCP